MSLAMPVMRIDGRMHHARVPLSYIGPDGQHLDIELNFACGSGHACGDAINGCVWARDSVNVTPVRCAGGQRELVGVSEQ